MDGQHTMEGWKMELRFNVTGPDRKRLAAAISEFTQCRAEYQYMPTCAYVIGEYTLTKEGTLICEESEVPTSLLSHLADAGFTAERDEEPDILTIQMPLAFFTETALANLDAMLAAKGDLIKKALGVTDLSVSRLEDRIEFPWFDGNADPNEIQAYEHFITAICRMAKTQKRINTCEKKTDNEKYAFRCFLLRLGFIGAEYKTERKILLRNLTGSSAFKGGRNNACTE